MGERVTVYLAASLRARLLGLAGLRELPPGAVLLIPRCSSVHTFGMRFPIHVLFLDSSFAVIGERRSVKPGRLVWQRGARAVVEFQAGEPTSPASR
ncbi:MAG: DUF192 domain-containing protein [Solirubrobacteraceae bacterium]